MSTIDLRPMTADGGNAEPGWYPDPVWCFPHRYWDGQYWTARVAVGGACHDDPIRVGPEPAQRTYVDFVRDYLVEAHRRGLIDDRSIRPIVDDLDAWERSPVLPPPDPAHRVRCRRDLRRWPLPLLRRRLTTPPSLRPGPSSSPSSGPRPHPPSDPSSSPPPRPRGNRAGEASGWLGSAGRSPTTWRCTAWPTWEPCSCSLDCSASSPSPSVRSGSGSAPLRSSRFRPPSWASVRSCDGGAPGSSAMPWSSWEGRCSPWLPLHRSPTVPRSLPT